MGSKIKSDGRMDNSDTDEGIVALALYLANTEERSAVIVTRDFDIRRIIRGIFGRMLYGRYAESFREALTEHPLRLYLIDGEEFGLQEFTFKDGRSEI